MPISLVKSSLSSRSVRNAIGLRSFTPSLSAEQKSGNIIQRFVGGAFRLGKFLFAPLLSFGAFAWNSFWGSLVQARNFIWTFNWNTSDQDLDRQARARWENMGSLLGGLAGNAFGWFSCGVLPGVSMFRFNPAMAVYVLKEVGEEALEELATNAAFVVRTIFRNLAQDAFSWGFKNFRHWMKQPDNVFAQALFGDRYAQVMKNWGRQGGPSWSFASALDEVVESIPNKFWRNFAEEFLEEAWDSCVEAGYVVTNSVESFLAMQRLQQETVLGSERVIEVTPDREASSEKIILAGPENVLKVQLPAVMVQHQLIENRDVGQFVGQTVPDEARMGDLTLRLKIILYNVAAPPWEGSRNPKVRRVTVTIPDVKRSKLDWEDIRNACGGRNGYMWGRFKSVAKLSNGRRMEVWGATKSEAEDRCKAFIALSEAELRTMNTTEELKEGDRLANPGLYKESTRIYPAYCFILNREKILSRDRGRPVGKHRYEDKRFRLDLWTSVKPFDWDETVQEALLRAGSTNTSSP